MEIIGWIIAIILIVLGIAGTVLPALPGAILVLIGFFLAAWLDDFAKVGGLTLTVLTVLTLLSFAVDLVAAAYGAKSVDASREALAGAVLGTIVGLFLGLPGLIFGPFVGAAAGELLKRRDLWRAGKVGMATWLGFVIGTAVKLGLVFVMVGIFITAYVWPGAKG